MHIAHNSCTGCNIECEYVVEAGIRRQAGGARVDVGKRSGEDGAGLGDYGGGWGALGTPTRKLSYRTRVTPLQRNEN